ncbi:MAG: prepilin-type N-terminal cleavage/methylation domain-containing protein [Burkholderiales bacterium]
MRQQLKSFFRVSHSLNAMKNLVLQSPCKGVAAQRGLSLIELLVALAIGLVVTLAVTTTLLTSSSNQRTSTALNDSLQTGAFAAASLDRVVRSAGSGLIQSSNVFGCLINAGIAPGPTQILPPATALPDPFALIGSSATGGVPVVLAPVVIVDGGSDAVHGQASDQLIIMSGSHGFSEVRLPIVPRSTTGTSTKVASTFGINANDLVLIAGGTGPCMVQQVLSTAAGGTINFGNKYFDAVGSPSSTTLSASFNAIKSPSVVPLGSAGATPADPDPNPPQFYVYGVNDANELVRYNLLAAPGTATALEVLSENVVSIQAIYGTGTPTTRVPRDPEKALDPDSPTALIWVAPTATGYGATGAAGGLLDGSATANALLRGIKSIRLAMVVRSPLQEKEPAGGTPAVSPPSLVMFADTASPVTYDIPAAQQNFRHRVIETIIPLRNL